MFFLHFCLFSQIYAQSTLDKVQEDLSQKYDFVSCFDKYGLALIGEQAKFGYLDKNGKVVVPFIYDKGNPFSEGKAAVKRNKKWGFVDSIGKEIIPCVYDSATSFVNGLAEVRKKKMVYWINEKNEIKDSIVFHLLLSQNKWDNLLYEEQYENKMRIIGTQSNLKGLKRIGEGKLVIDTIYNEIIPVNETSIFHIKKGSLSFLLNIHSGKIAKNYSYTTKMENSFSAYNEKGQLSILDTNFEVTLPFDKKNRSVEQIQDSFFLVTQIDSSQIDTIPNPRYNPAVKASLQKSAIVRAGDEDGDGSATGINSASCKAKTPENQTHTSFDNPIDSIYIGPARRIGIINHKGKWILPPKYNFIFDKTNKYILAYAKGEWRVVEVASGKETTHFPYFYPINNTNPYSLAPYFAGNSNIVTENKDKKQGILRPNGEILLPFEYDNLNPLSLQRHLFIASKGKYVGLVDENGKLLHPCAYLHISDANQDSMIALITGENKLGFMNLKQKKLIIPQYDANLKPYFNEPIFKEGVAVVSKNGEWGYIDSLGKEITPFIYTEATNFENGIAYAKTSTEAYFIDKKGGKISIPNDFEVAFNGLVEWGFDEDNFANIKNRHLIHKENKYGFIDDNGEIVIPMKYEKPSHISDNELIGTYTAPQMKYGLADTTGKIIVPVEYTRIQHPAITIDIKPSHILPYFVNDSIAQTYRKVEKESKMGILDKKGNIMYNADYQFIGSKKENEWWIEKEGKIGIMNDKKEIVFPIEYEYIEPLLDKTKIKYSKGGRVEMLPPPFRYLVRKNKKWGITNVDYTKMIIPLTMDSIMVSQLSWGYNFYFVKENGKYGIIDSSGKRLFPSIINAKGIKHGTNMLSIQDKYQFLTQAGNVLPEKYDSFKVTPRRYLLVFTGKNKFYLDAQGKKMLSADYQDILFSGKDWFVVKKKDKYGIVRANNKVLVACKYDSIAQKNYHLPHLWFIQEKGKWGALDTNFQVSIPLKYDNIDFQFFNIYVYFIRTKKEGKYGALNPNGKEILPAIYDTLTIAYGQKWIKVGKNKQQGLFDENGKMILPIEYQQINLFSKGLAVVQKNDKCGVIDTFGKEIVPLKYEGLNVVNGFIVTKTDCKYGLLDSLGRTLLPMEYDMISPFSASSLLLMKENKSSLYLINRNKIISGFNFLQSLSNAAPLFLVEKTQNNSRKFGVIDENEKFIIPLEYDNIWIEPYGDRNIISAIKNNNTEFFTFKGTKLQTIIRPHRCLEDEESIKDE